MSKRIIIETDVTSKSTILEFRFSTGHFTILTATQRHGTSSWKVSAKITVPKFLQEEAQAYYGSHSLESAGLVKTYQTVTVSRYYEVPPCKATCFEVRKELQKEFDTKMAHARISDLKAKLAKQEALINPPTEDMMPPLEHTSVYGTVKRPSFQEGLDLL